MPGAGKFLLEFLRHPVATAAVAPSSRQLADAMVAGIDFSRVRTVVEYGPGTGAFTRRVLEAFDAAPAPGRTLLAIERNERMASSLGAELRDARVVHGDAMEVEALVRGAGLESVDLVVSGLGWPSLPAPVREGILEGTAKVLGPGGEFRTFGYHIGLTLPGAWAFRGSVRRLFSSVSITPVVWANIPPAFVYRCVK